jgi:hypothetical protein
MSSPDSGLDGYRVRAASGGCPVRMATGPTCLRSRPGMRRSGLSPVVAGEGRGGRATMRRGRERRCNGADVRSHRGHLPEGPCRREGRSRRLPRSNGGEPSCRLPECGHPRRRGGRISGRRAGRPAPAPPPPRRRVREVGHPRPVRRRNPAPQRAGRAGFGCAG